MESGGVGGKVEIYNWEGDLLWSHEVSDQTYQHHHDIDVLPNGNILLVDHVYRILEIWILDMRGFWRYGYIGILEKSIQSTAFANEPQRLARYC